MVELDEETVSKELEYFVTLGEAESNPTIENLRKALRLRMRNKIRRDGWRGKARDMDSSIDSLAAEARNTAEWKIYDAVEGVDL